MCVCVCETVNVYVSVCGGWGVGRQMCLCVWGVCGGQDVCEWGSCGGQGVCVCVGGGVKVKVGRWPVGGMGLEGDVLPDV